MDKCKCSCDVKCKLCKISFLLSCGVTLYILGISWLLMNAENLFGTANKIWGPAIMLLLFVFSALVTGLLVLGYPVWLYLEQRKKDAVRLLLCNVGWLFGFIFLFFAIMIIAQ